MGFGHYTSEKYAELFLFLLHQLQHFSQAPGQLSSLGLYLKVFLFAGEFLLYQLFVRDSWAQTRVLAMLNPFLPLWQSHSAGTCQSWLSFTLRVLAVNGML